MTEIIDIEPIVVDEEDTTVGVDTENNSVEESSGESLSMDEISTLTKYIQVQGIKDSLNNELEKVTDAKQELFDSLKGTTDEKDFLQDKLDTYESVEALKEYLKSDDNVIAFYTNDETGEVLDLASTIDDPARAMQFKRELLIYLKTSDVAHAAIDKEYEELERATAEMDKNIRDVSMQLSDNVLTYTAHLRDKAEQCEDETMKNKIMTAAKYIESGYNFAVLQEVIDEHPSVLYNTVSEFMGSSGIERTGKRYTDKLKRYNIKVSLIPLVSNGNNKSIEEFVLIANDEYKLPDLFIYSAIRYFAMANWNDENVKRFHASFALVMKRLMNNEFDDELRQTILADMVKYLAQFSQYIDD